MEEQNEISQKLKALVTNAEQMKGKEFRLALEEIVNEGEEEAEYLLVQYLTDHTLSAETRMDFIRMAGHLQRSSFLVPLKKILDTEQHSRIQQEAILAVAKFNDRRALNILNQALQKMNNPLLLGTLNAEISRIKENNPILALLPRFKEGQRSPKTFKITLQVLKRILNPADATIFTKFLGSDDPLIQNGAFEILCITGDIFHDAEIIAFYETHFNSIPCIKEKECEELYMLTYHFKLYLSRYQFLIEEQIPSLKEQYVKVNDIRVKQLLLSLICKSKTKETIAFLQDIYPKDSKMKATIIEELSGNEAAVDFLFDLYRADKELKEKIIQSLLHTKQGLDYFIREFLSLAFDEQESIARNLPYAGQYDLTDFIKQMFQSNVFRLKEILLAKVSETYEFSVEEILFDPDNEREFFFMGDQYLDAILQLFPVTAVKRLLEKIATPDLWAAKTRKFISKIGQAVASELIINFKDKDFVTALFNRVIKSNNVDLNVEFLGILKSVKTLDAATYHNLNGSLGLFVAQRETKLTPAEKGGLNRIKRNLNDIYYELKRVEEGTTALQNLVKTDPVDFGTLTHILKSYPLAVLKHKEPLFTYLSKQFQKCTSGNVGEWSDFFAQFPRIAGILKTVVQGKVENQEDLAYKALQDLNDALSGNPVRIVMNFKNRGLLAALREEFREVDPGVPVVSYDYDLKDMDILLCDAEMLRDLILQGKTIPEKIFLFLENLDGFSDFKSYNPKNFVKPFLYYRIIKEILHEIYT